MPAARSTRRSKRRCERLKRERDEGDRVYNEAFTALDHALMRLPEFPHPPPPYDEHQITPLNAVVGHRRRVRLRRGHGGQAVRRAEGAPRGVRLAHRRSAAAEAGDVQLAARRSPQPERGGAPRGAARDRQRDRDAARPDRRTCSLFQSRLVVYLQQITLYVDTKDRETAGQALIVNAALNGDGRGAGEAVGIAGRARAALRGARGRPRRRARRAAHGSSASSQQAVDRR